MCVGMAVLHLLLSISSMLFVSLFFDNALLCSFTNICGIQGLFFFVSRAGMKLESPIWKKPRI